MKFAKSKRISHLSSGKGFYQEKRGHLRNKAEIFRLHPPSLMVWEFLKERANRTNEAHFTEAVILAETGLCRATLFRAYRILEDRLWILRDEGRVHLNAKLYWRGIKPGTLALAKLNCDIVIPGDVQLPDSLRRLAERA